MNKSYYKRLMQHAESCQEEDDKTAYLLTSLIDEISVLASVQSICDFNLFWLASISPVIIYDQSLQFLANHKSEFKRKLSIEEMIEFDWIIAHNEITCMEEFKIHLKTSRATKNRPPVLQPLLKMQRSKKQKNNARA